MFSTSIFSPSPCPSTVHIFLFFFSWIFLRPSAFIFFSLHFLPLSPPPAMCRAFNLPAIFLSVSLHLSFQFHHHASIHQTASIFISSFFFLFFLFSEPSVSSSSLTSCSRIFFFSSSPSSLFHFAPTSTSFCTRGRVENAKSPPTEWNMLGCSLRLAAV